MIYLGISLMLGGVGALCFLLSDRRGSRVRRRRPARPAGPVGPARPARPGGRPVAGGPPTVPAWVIAPSLKAGQCSAARRRAALADNHLADASERPKAFHPRAEARRVLHATRLAQARAEAARAAEWRVAEDAIAAERAQGYGYGYGSPAASPVHRYDSRRGWPTGAYAAESVSRYEAAAPTGYESPVDYEPAVACEHASPFGYEAARTVAHEPAPQSTGPMGQSAPPHRPTSRGTVYASAAARERGMVMASPAATPEVPRDLDDESIDHGLALFRADGWDSPSETAVGAGRS